ncbi:hypothetical protein O4J56_10685 [Nocardiopsis sp. RSe5-2]|uniref:Uncharacterized protein n=1 Tax=Nocardiopsis endophytica TaxID=3018445 RepID=A0ABT4U2E4_9ACTN|nr:hypothetical protein [Nocardiopsis endophytica]MDA2811103.1 hypothetical protein [Nocardiopsis endophytica]
MILLHGLVDDAGLLPPAPLPLFQALQRNRTDRILAHPLLSRRLLCPSGLLPDLARRAGRGDGAAVEAALDGAVQGEVDRELQVDHGPQADREPQAGPGRGPGDGPPGPDHGRAVPPRTPLDVGVVLDDGGGAVPADVTGLPGVRVVHVETWALPEEVRRAALLARVGGSFRLRTVYFEMPRGSRRVESVAALSGARPLGMRIRCHGTRSCPPPGVTELADTIAECVFWDVPFRVAAGQHRAVSAPAVGGLPARHGYLNVLLATAAAVEGAGAGEVREVLRTTDEELIAARFAAVGWRTALRTRRVFTGMGARSTGEPPRDVERLGLLGTVGEGVA